MPSTVPSTKATTTGVSPARSVMRPPWRSRLSMSRPCSSVPSGWSGAPMGASRRRMEPAVGSCGASTGASTADSTMASSRTLAAMVVGSRRSRQATVRQYDMGAPTTSWASAGATLMATSVPDDPRVDDGLQHVDREVQEDEEGGEHQDHALEHRDVTLEDGEVQQIPRARPREDGLDQHRAAQLEAELQADDGEDLGRGVLHDVGEDRAVEEALRPQRQHEFLGEDVERRRADHARDDAERDERQGHGGQRHVAEIVHDAAVDGGAHGRQPVELHREDDDEDDARPVRSEEHTSALQSLAY